MNKESLNILMLEDNPLDADLIKEQLLLLEEYDCIVKVIQDKTDYINLIEACPPPDLILCDYNLPQYNGMEALKDLNYRRILIPFIFVTGTMKEEIAADAIKAGAWDYVVKDRLFRLPLAVRSVLKLKKEKEISFEAEKKTQRILKAIEETSAQIMVLDHQANIEYINKNFTDVTGYTFNEVIGKPISDFLPEHDENMNSMREIIKKGKVFKGDICNLRKEKEKYWEHISITPILNDQNVIRNYIIIKEDITQQKKIENDLIVSEERLQLALTGADLGLWDWNIKTSELIVNERWAEMLGYTIDEIEPKVDTWINLIHPDDWQEVKTILDEHLNGETTYYITEHRLKTKGGEWKWILDRGKVLERDKEGNAVRAAGTHMDITDRKQAEHNLNQTIEEYLSLNEELKESLNRIEKINKDLEKAKQQAEESDNLKTAFLANLSHEIRTPMNGIIGFADLLKSESLSHSLQKKYLTIIEESGQRLIRLINDLVDISMIESKQVEIKEEKTNLNELLDKIYDFFRLQVKAKGLNFTLKKGLPKNDSCIITDSLKLEQILTNLVNNALKFTESGSINIIYSLEDSFLEFKVKDTGLGIIPGKERIIFERFRQADNTYFKGIEGTGLGLAISKAFVELMGGTISVKSTYGKGSEFTFTLPYHPAGKIKTGKKQYPVHQFDTGITILVAEDDEVSFIYLQQILHNYEFKLLRATNGEEAIKLVNENRDIQIILMDLKMPVMNGVDTTIEIRKVNPDIPIIAQTAYVSDSDKQKAIGAGCNDFITKPVKKDELLRKMELLLNMGTLS